MRNKWFYPGLFRESLRQLRVVGITAFVILEVGALCLAAGYLMDGLSESSYMESMGAEMTRRLVESVSTVPLLLVIPALLAPVMTLYLFHHLNKRNAGDFYHALPCKRQALFLSQLAAVAVWITAILLIHTVTGVVLMLCMSKWYAINLVGIAVMAFNCFAASMLVVGGVALAMSLTGTLFTNLVASALLLFGPRVLLTFVSLFLSLPTVNREHLLGVLDPPYNLVSNVLVSLFSGEEPSVIRFLPGGIYTLCLSLVYMALALWAFCRRHSETAGRSAGSSVMQAIFRLAVTMLICLIPCGLILTCINEGRVPSSYVLGIVVTYIIALIGYFLYELITTKKLRNLVRSLPMLGVLAVLNVVLILGVVGVKQLILHRDIAPEQVASVSIQSTEEPMTGYSGDNDYFDQQESKVVFTDPAMVEVLANGFTENNKLLRQSQAKYNTMTQTYTRNLVRFNMKGGTAVYRYVYLKPADQEILTEKKLQNQELRRVYLELPALDGVGKTCSVAGLSRQNSETLYEMLRAELAQTDFEVWYHFLKNEAYAQERYEYEQLNWIQLNYTVGVDNATASFNIPTFLTKTCDTYLALYEQEDPGAAEELAETFRKYADKFEEGKIDYNDGMISYVDLTILPMLGDKKDVYNISIWEDNESMPLYDTEAVADLLDSLAGTPATKTGPMYCITLSVSDGMSYGAYEAYVVMPGGTVDELLSSGAYILQEATGENAEKWG